MLGKLFKYEFRHTAKTMFLTYAALVLFTLMASAALYRMNRGLDSDKTFFTVLSTTMLILYIIAIIAIYCVDFIYLIYQYYKTMYSAQGYLTHTLPVSPTAVFSVKILAMFVWMFFSSMLSVLSVLILLQIGSGGEFSHAFSDIVWSSFTQGVNDIFGISGFYFLFSCAVEAILGILLYILWIAASMAVGQLAQKNRTVYSILAGLAFYMISQIVNTIFLAVSGYSLSALLDGDAASFMKTILNGNLIITAVSLVILCGICIYINNRKLNLE